MCSDDTYRTVDAGARAKRTVEGSQFLAEVHPATSRDEVETHLEAVRKRAPKATHHCMAYRLGAAGDDFRYDDDGEPSGTAGRPILRQIDARDLTNTVVVVTRYFGGTKLGTGGLARAYADAASDVLDAASIVEQVVRVQVRVRFSYDDTSPAQQVLAQFDTEIRDRRFTDVTEWALGVRRSQVDAFTEAFTNALGGRGEILSVEDR